MSTERTIEQRLAADEEAVVALQSRLDQLAPPSNWIDRLATFKDVPAADFQEVLRLGREALRRGEMEEGDGPPA